MFLPTTKVGCSVINLSTDSVSTVPCLNESEGEGCPVTSMLSCQ